MVDCDTNPDFSIMAAPLKPKCHSSWKLAPPVSSKNKLPTKFMIFYDGHQSGLLNQFSRLAFSTWIFFHFLIYDRFFLVYNFIAMKRISKINSAHIHSIRSHQWMQPAWIDDYHNEFFFLKQAKLNAAIQRLCRSSSSSCHLHRDH